MQFLCICISTFWSVTAIFFGRLCLSFLMKTTNICNTSQRFGLESGKHVTFDYCSVWCHSTVGSGDVTFCSYGPLNWTAILYLATSLYHLLCVKFWSCPLKMVGGTGLWSPNWHWAHSFLLVFCFSLKVEKWLVLLHSVICIKVASFLVQYVAYYFLLSFLNSMFK